MGLFDRFRKPLPDVELAAVLERVRWGDTHGALAAITAKLEATGKRVGVTTPGYAAVLYEHATVCLAIGMTPHAIASMRAAACITGPTTEDEKNRLTYLMNLSETLAHHGEMDEAMQTARDGLECRERFYGREHPGYAYGLETLAEVALALGNYDEALRHAKLALAIYDEHDHFKVPHSWALLFLAAAGIGARWHDLEIGPGMATAVIQELVSRVIPVSATVELSALETLAPLAGDQEVVLEAWKRLTGRAQAANDYATRIVALSRIADIADTRSDPVLGVDASLGLALAHDAQGNVAEAVGAYELAESRARASGSAEVLRRALRNAGLFFVKDTPERGIALLREAAQLTTPPGEDHARSLIALGIQLQHRAELSEARPLLVSALAILDPTHPDAVCAQSHLRALDQHGSCECQGTTEEVHAQVERIVREHLPSGLVEGVDFKDGDVSIRVTRVMTESEARHVADTVHLAMAEMRKRHSQTYGG